MMMYCHVPKMNEKKVKDLQRKMHADGMWLGCVRALGARPPHSKTRPDTTPNPSPNGQNPDKADVRLGSRGGVGLNHQNERGGTRMGN